MRKEAKFRSIWIDIDGTLLNENKIITPSTLYELRRISFFYDVKIILTSSRPPKSIELISNELEINHPIVAYNGALINSQKNKVGKRKILFSKIIQQNNVKKIIEYVRAVPSTIHMSLYSFNKWYVNIDDSWTKYEIKNTGIVPIYCVSVMDIDNLVSRTAGFHKILFCGNSEEMNTIEDFLNTEMKGLVTWFRTKGSAIEIAPYEVTKGKALKILEAISGFQMRKSLAFGDSINDLDLLMRADYSVAMGNAVANLKIISNEITLSNNNDGVAIVIKRFFP